MTLLRFWLIWWCFSCLLPSGGVPNVLYDVYLYPSLFPWWFQELFISYQVIRIFCSGPGKKDIAKLVLSQANITTLQILFFFGANSNKMLLCPCVCYVMYVHNMILYYDWCFSLSKKCAYVLALARASGGALWFKMTQKRPKPPKINIL